MTVQSHFARALAVPVGAVVETWNRYFTPKHTILEIRLGDKADLEARSAFLLALQRAATDKHIEAVLFIIDGVSGGRAAVEDLRGAIRALRAAGKSVYAYLEGGGNQAMWVAAACEQVIVVPTGDLALVGTGTEMIFVGQALERLGLQPMVLAAGAYKSAGETFTRTHASPANLEATRTLLQGLQDQLVRDLAADRERTPEQIQEAMAEAPLRAEQALAAGLVDQLLYLDQLDEWLEERHGEKAKRLKFAEWAGRTRRIAAIQRWGDPSKCVAVVHLEGPIVMEAPPSSSRIRARTIQPLLKELREDDTVGAVVLHINSPGGGVLASDLIWREVEQLRLKKPVVASYEDVSASGGVYLSAPASEVLARSSTVTGSVGVFGMFFTPREGMRKLGVHAQQVLTAPNAAMGLGGLTPEQRGRMRGMIDSMYDGFVERVATGRKISQEAIEPHCRGRVWTGTQAVGNGLVDQLGNLDDAVARARELAGLRRNAPRREVSGKPEVPFVARMIRENLKDTGLPIAALSTWFTRQLGPKALDTVELLLEHEGQAMALLPFEVESL